MEVINKVEEVFGVSRDLPKTYVERKLVDKVLVANLARKKHIVIHGGSKQGKTSLRKSALEESDCVVVQCQGGKGLRELYSMILKEAGAEITVSESKTISGASKVWVKFKANLKIPFTGGVEAETAAEATRTNSTTKEIENIEIDISDANDVIRILKEMEFKKFIVLEDFHYLDIDVQKLIAIDLKIFHEKSDISFIVVGVWMEQNRLVLYNGDLTNRVIPINADVWTGEELHSVISAGETLLNIKIHDDAVRAIISASHSNVGLVQEICWNLCESSAIYETQKELVGIGTTEQVDEIVTNMSHNQSGRYRNFINDFSEGFQHTEHELHKWIMAIVICQPVEQLKTGILQSELYRLICKTHCNKDKLKLTNVVQALRNCSRLQQKKHVQPVILDYNANENRLKVVDSGFLLFLEREDTADLLDVMKMVLKSTKKNS